MGGDGGGQGFPNPFENVSMTHPFGGSALGHLLGDAPNDNAKSPQQTMKDIQDQVDQSQDLLKRTQQQAQQAQQEADTAAAKAGRQSEADTFTKGLGDARNKLSLGQSLQGLQDLARQKRGRSLFQS